MMLKSLTSANIAYDPNLKLQGKSLVKSKQLGDVGEPKISTYLAHCSKFNSREAGIPT